MDRKLAGMGIGAMLVIGLVTIMGFAFAQGPETTQATEFVDVDGDGVCDNAGDCPYKGQVGGFVDENGNGVCDNTTNCQKHQNRGKCHGSEECPRMKEGFRGEYHRTLE